MFEKEISRVTTYILQAFPFNKDYIFIHTHTHMVIMMMLNTREKQERERGKCFENRGWV